MAKLISVRDLVSQASMEIGITQIAVTQVFDSRDQDVVQMGALINAVADEVLLDEPYKYTLGDDVWVTDSLGNPKMFATTNDDLIAIDSRLMIDGLKYQFLQAKGLEFAEQLRSFTVRLNKLARRQNERVLDLDVDEGRII